MMTIKRVETTGHEAVHEIKSVSFQPRMGEVPPVLYIELPNGEIMTWDVGGTFFVMNDAGKTVARYWLGRECLPCHKDTEAA